MKKSIFKSIDEFINEQSNNFRSSQLFTQFSDIMRNFSEREQLLINQISSLVIIFIPAIALLTLVYLRFSSSQELELRQNVLEKMLAIKTETAELISKEKNLVANDANFEDKKEFIDSLNQILEAKKIDTANIIVNNFEIVKESGTLKLIEAQLKFKDLTSIAFTNFLLEIQVKYKSNIEELETTKDITKLLIGGTLKISFYSKVER